MIKNRIGIIDIGTNTFNLLVVDRTDTGFEKVFYVTAGVGLGLGGINDRMIAQDAIQRGVQTIDDFLIKCKGLQVEKVKAFATSAVRDARNKEEFLDELDERFDLDVEVISGEREAQLIYEGIKVGYDFKYPNLIMDIGGGSTEFIYADNNEIIKSQSFDIGTSRIYQSFEFEDPFTKLNVNQVINYLESRTEGFFDDITSDVLIGASGSFETFYAILYRKDYEEKEFEILAVSELNDVLEEMIYSTLEERQANPFIIPIRKKMAPIAAIMIKWVLDKLKVKQLIISPYAMKEGVIQTI